MKKLIVVLLVVLVFVFLIGCTSENNKLDRNLGAVVCHKLHPDIPGIIIRKYNGVNEYGVRFLKNKGSELTEYRTPETFELIECPESTLNKIKELNK